MSLIELILNLSLDLSYFSLSIYVEILWEFCLMRNSADFVMSFKIFFLSFAVVIIPIVSFKDPKIMKVVPYLLSRSNEIPPILQSWKNEPVCF